MSQVMLLYFMNILVAINGSLISENAAKYALNYAKSIKSGAIFLHVIKKRFTG